MLAGELVGAEDDGVLLEGIEVAGPDRLVEAACLQDDGRQEELVRQFLAPLLAQVGRHDDQQAALSFGPVLGEQEPGLDGLAQPDFVGQDRTLREGAAEGEECGLDLMGIQIDLGIGQHRRELLDAVGGTAFGELVGKILGVKVGQVHAAMRPECSVWSIFRPM